MPLDWIFNRRTLDGEILVTGVQVKVSVGWCVCVSIGVCICVYVYGCLSVFVRVIPCVRVCPRIASSKKRSKSPLPDKICRPETSFTSVHAGVCVFQ